MIVPFDQDHFGENLNVSSGQLEKLQKILPDIIYKKFPVDTIKDVDALLVALTIAFVDLKGPLNLNVEVKNLSNGGKQLVAEYIVEIQTNYAIQAAFLITSFIMSPLDSPPVRLKEQIHYIMRYLAKFGIGELLQNMLQAAKKLNIPYSVFDQHASLVLYGLGANAVLYNHAASEFDSNIGYRTQKDKITSNAMIKMAGYPTTDQKVAPSLEACRAIVGQMGFPLVIKPHSEGQGRGVAANIKSMEQAIEAYNVAAKYSPGSVLIENYVVGNDYRIVVAQGKVVRVNGRRPAYVIGDGKNNIRTLIGIENKRRENRVGHDLNFKKIEIDDMMVQFLKEADRELDEIPDVGIEVILRGNANVSTGGSLSILDEADVHPDNIEMAINVAAVFRLDAAGLDFLSPDISRSWRECGAIIEVNAYQMVSASLAEIFLENRFQELNNGQIDTILIVTDNPDFSIEIFNRMQQDYSNLGFADHTRTILNRGDLRIEYEGLYGHCLALISNPNCDGIVVAITVDEIVRRGLPIDYFDQCLIDENSNFDCAAINDLVKNSTGVDSLQEWLEGYAGDIKKL